MAGDVAGPARAVGRSVCVSKRQASLVAVSACCTCSAQAFYNKGPGWRQFVITSFGLVCIHRQCQQACREAVLTMTPTCLQMTGPYRGFPPNKGRYEPCCLGAGRVLARDGSPPPKHRLSHTVLALCHCGG